MDLLFLAILIFVGLELALFRRRSPEAFERIFSFSPVPLVIAGGLVVFALLFVSFHWEQKQTLFALLIFFVVGVYMRRRILFKRILAGEPSGKGSPRVLMASETLEIFLFWFSWMVVGAVGIKGASKFCAPLASPMAEAAIFSTYSSVVMLFLILRISRRQPFLNLQALTGLRSCGQSFWRLWVFPVLLGIFWAGLCVVILATRSTKPPTPFGQMMESVNSLGGFLAFVLAAVVLAPFLEEVIFRGFLFSVIQFIRGKWLAFLVVSGVFTLMHVEQYWGDVLTIVMVGVLGVWLTWLRVWTGSSIPGIMAHYAFNGAMVVFPFWIMFFSNPVYFEYQIQYSRLDNQGREALLEQSLRQHPGHALSCNDLAWLYAEENKNLDQALSLVEKALTSEPDNYAFLDTKAEVLYKLGRVKEAIAIEEGLLKRYPDNLLIQEQLEKFRHGLHP